MVLGTERCRGAGDLLVRFGDEPAIERRGADILSLPVGPTCRVGRSVCGGSTASCADRTRGEWFVDGRKRASVHNCPDHVGGRRVTRRAGTPVEEAQSALTRRPAAWSSRDGDTTKGSGGPAERSECRGRPCRAGRRGPPVARATADEGRRVGRIDGGVEPARRRAVSPCRVRRGGAPRQPPCVHKGSAGSRHLTGDRSQCFVSLIVLPGSCSPRLGSPSSLSEICSCSPACSMFCTARSVLRLMSVRDLRLTYWGRCGRTGQGRIAFSRGQGAAVPASPRPAGSPGHAEGVWRQGRLPNRPSDAAAARTGPNVHRLPRPGSAPHAPARPR